MNKKMMMIVAILASLSLLAVMAFAGSGNENGYQLFKEALKQEKELPTAGTMEGYFQVEDNGSLVISFEGIVGGDLEKEQFGGNLQVMIEDFQKDLTLYLDRETYYLFDEEDMNLYVGQQEEHDGHDDFDFHDQDHEGFNEVGEGLLDFFIGDLKNDFRAVKADDGTTDVVFELKNNEIPAFVNLLLSAKGDHHDFDDDEEELDVAELAEVMALPIVQELMALEDYERPSIVDQQALEEVMIFLDLDEEKAIIGAEFSITLTGEDEFGDFHRLTMKGKVSFSEGETQLMTLPDLDGYTRYELPGKEK